MYNFIFQLTIQEERHANGQMLMAKVLSSHNNKAQDTCEFGLIEA